MSNLDIRQHVERRVESGYAEVVVAIKRGDEIRLYEGLACSISVEMDHDEWFCGDVAHSIDCGRTMSINFVGSIREKEGS